MLTAVETVKLFVATKAFISHEGKVLILRESSQYADGSNRGRFDVPGGRVHPGQHFGESLVREIREETGLEVKVGNPFYVGEWRPVVHGEQWQVVGIFFSCTADSNKVRLSADHDEFAWVAPSEFGRYQLIDNLVPAFDRFLSLQN